MRLLDQHYLSGPQAIALLRRESAQESQASSAAVRIYWLGVSHRWMRLTAARGGYLAEYFDECPCGGA